MGLVVAIIFIIGVIFLWLFSGGYDRENLFNILIIFVAIILFFWLFGFIFSLKIKTWHIINTVFVGLIALASLGNLSKIFSGTFFKQIGLVKSFLFNFIVQILPTIFGFITIAWIIFLILSFSKTNVENKYYKYSSIISLSTIIILPIIAIIIGVLFGGSGDITMGLASVGAMLMYGMPIIYFILTISFIVFLIGYYKNKINKKIAEAEKKLPKVKF